MDFSVIDIFKDHRVWWILSLSMLYWPTVFAFLYFGSRGFRSTDKKPPILPISFLNKDGDFSRTVGIKTGLFIKSFPGFDIIKNDFILDGVVWFEFNPSLISLETLGEFTFDNASKVTKSKPDIRLLHDTLYVKYNVSVSFSANLDNQFFPMNDHQLFIVMINENFLPTEVVFHVDNSCFDYSDDMDTRDWVLDGKNVESGYMELQLDEFSGRKMSYPQVIFTLNLKKRGLRKAALIILPTLMILFLGTTTALPYATKSVIFISIAITCVTGLIAYRFVINSISPNVGYFTFTDHFFNFILAESFVNVLLTVRSICITSESGGMDVGIIWFVAGQLLILALLYFLLFRWKPYFKTQNNVSSKLHDLPALRTLKLYQNIRLSNFVSFRNTISQNVPADNDDPLDPIYDTYYLAYKRTWFHQHWYTCWQTSKSCCSPEFMTDLLMACQRADVLNGRNRPDLQTDASTLNDPNFILKLPVSNASNVAIFADVSGSFHALVGHLQQLNKMKLLDDDLQLLSSDDYIIFNGNVMEGSPYLLETLSIVMTLLLKNPKQVFYVRGQNEGRESWKGQQIGEEIKCKLSTLGKRVLKHIPMLMDQFLSSLPLAIYLHKVDGNKTSLVRVSSYPFYKGGSESHPFKAFICAHSNTVESFELESGIIPDEFALGVSLDAMIQRDGTFRTFRSGTTLSFLPQLKGVSVWGIRSSYRLQQPSDVGFAVLRTQSSAQNWSITSYHKPREELCDYHSNVFSMMYGYALNASVQLSQEIVTDDFIVSSTMDLSRSASVVSQRLCHGIDLKLVDQNALGGVRGQRLKLVIFDDEYIPALAQKNVLDLMQRYPSKILLSPVGTVTLEWYAPRIFLDKNVLVMFPITGGSLLRKPECEHIVFFRSSFAKEAQTLITFAIEKKGVQRLAIFYQNDAAGQEVFNGVKQTLEDCKIAWLAVPYQRNNPNVEQGATEIRNFNADAIIFFSTANPAIALIKKLGVAQVAGISLLAVSYAANSFQEFLQSMNLKLIRTHLVPPLDSDISIVQEYRQAIKSTLMNMGPTDESLEGYINVSLLAYILESIEPPITNKKIIERVSTIRSFDFKGLPLNFNPMTRELYNEIWIESD